mmetsp:Transcript_35181/g.105069  ORF Transcript_35181/g.105069 Transcript_35181/m.105069 type:complete len:118 (+) Transcript_35181:3696-4049(+)
MTEEMSLFFFSFCGSLPECRHKPLNGEEEIRGKLKANVLLIRQVLQSRENDGALSIDRVESDSSIQFLSGAEHKFSSNFIFASYLSMPARKLNIHTWSGHTHGVGTFIQLENMHMKK